jgi:hypothetical protein
MIRASVAWRLAITTALVLALLLLARTEMDFVYAGF